MKQEPPEEWRPVVGYEGRYEVSDQGRVRSLVKSTPRILKPGRMPDGRLQLVLTKDGKKFNARVHRLVIAAFEGPCPEGMEVCHSNGDPGDNRLENLRYGTRSENALDSVRHGSHNNVSKTRCPQGHKYDDENTYVDPMGRRLCRTCRDAKRECPHCGKPFGVRNLSKHIRRIHR